jgi:hypothetical protein
MMASENAEGLIELLVERFETQQLPRILELERSVAAGNTITEFEQEFLEAVCREAIQSKQLVDQFPQYQPLFARVVHLYRKITMQALENEERQIRTR